MHVRSYSPGNRRDVRAEYVRGQLTPAEEEGVDGKRNTARGNNAAAGGSHASQHTAKVRDISWKTCACQFPKRVRGDIFSLHRDAGLNVLTGA